MHTPANPTLMDAQTAESLATIEASKMDAVHAHMRAVMGMSNLPMLERSFLVRNANATTSSTMAIAP